MSVLKNRFLIFICSFFALFLGDNAQAGRNAKVVVAGPLGAGKTTLINLITEGTGKEEYDHTANLSDKSIERIIDGEEVRIMFMDTSGEENHKSIIKDFYKNAHVIFLVFSAEDFYGNSKSETLQKKYFEEMLKDIVNSDSNARLVLVLTKIGNINEDNEYEDPEFKQEEVKSYLNIYSKLQKYNKKLDGIYDLMLYSDTTQNEIKTHQDKLMNIIISSLKKIGINRLPKNSDNFRGTIMSKKVIDQEETCTKDEKSHYDYYYVNQN